MFREDKILKNYLEKVYKKEDKNTFVIEIDLNKYIEIFSEWDKSALIRRSIHPELEEFLDICSEEIPLKYKISIYLYLPLSIKSEEKEKIIVDSIKNYYNYRLIDYYQKNKNSKKEAIKYLIISSVVLVLTYILKKYLNLNIIFKTLNEILIIGAWVFMWEFFSKFFFANQKLIEKQKQAERFINSNIIFKYEEKK